MSSAFLIGSGQRGKNPHYLGRRDAVLLADACRLDFPAMDHVVNGRQAHLQRSTGVVNPIRFSLRAHLRLPFAFVVFGFAGFLLAGVSAIARRSSCTEGLGFAGAGVSPTNIDRRGRPAKGSVYSFLLIFSAPVRLSSDQRLPWFLLSFFELKGRDGHFLRGCSRSSGGGRASKRRRNSSPPLGSLAIRRTLAIA